MGALRTRHLLTWTMTLSEEGYSAVELVDENDRRWGWIVNAAATGWTAHVGDWGQAEDVGQDPVALDDKIEHFDDLGAAQTWVAEQVADGWRTHQDAARTRVAG